MGRRRRLRSQGWIVEAAPDLAASNYAAVAMRKLVSDPAAAVPVDLLPWASATVSPDLIRPIFLASSAKTRGSGGVGASAVGNGDRRTGGAAMGRERAVASSGRLESAACTKAVGEARVGVEGLVWPRVFEWDAATVQVACGADVLVVGEHEDLRKRERWARSARDGPVGQSVGRLPRADGPWRQGSGNASVPRVLSHDFPQTRALPGVTSGGRRARSRGSAGGTWR